MSERINYIVIVQRTELTKDVYGPYTTFGAATGDAIAWGGTVEPVQKPTEHQFKGVHSQ